jgi:beta-glucanase (GH16 family)
MQLVAENRSALTDWGETKSYASGAINTRNKFAFTFGVVEARLRLPQGAGLASLFYLEPNNKRSPPEINIMNGLGSNASTASFNYKYYDINGVVRALVGNVAGVDYSDSYHTFTVDWSPTSIRFFVDGVLHGTYTGDSILRDDAFLVLSLAVGGSMAGTPSGIGFPQTMEVDYVRVWQ